MAKKPSPRGARRWADPGLKCLLTVSWLLREKGQRTLNAAIKKHVGEDDGYVSDEMEAFLVEHPLGDAELATFEAVAFHEDWSHDLCHRLMPMWDGEDAPFRVERWDDLVRLPNVRRVVCDREDAIPSPEVVSRLPKLETLVVSMSRDLGKRRQNPALELQSAGLFVSHVDYRRDWTTLKRAERGPSVEIFSTLSRRFPKDIYRRGKGGFTVALGSVSFDSGALVARVELTLFRPEEPLVHAIGGEHEGPAGDLLLLGAEELAGEEAAALLEERIDKLVAHITSERSLPASLT